jgi:hypothetical protein
MKPAARESLAITCLVVAIPFGFVAALQFFDILNGTYDPVAHDGARPEDVPAHRVRLVIIIIAASVSSIIAGWHLRRRKASN